MKNKGLSYFLRLQVGFLWLLCMVLCSQLHAQEHLTRNMLMLSNLNTDNGLSSARVYSIVEAEDGAMWISTKRGVDRYNGQQVRNYTLATDMQFSDASGRNIKLTKNSQQHIYAYDNKGKIYKYDKVKDTFQLQVDLLNVLGGNVVLNDLLVDDKGCFWMALDRGVYRMAPQSIAGSKDKRAPRSPNKGKYILKNTYVNHIRFVGKQLLIGSPSGVFAYSPNAAQPRLLLRGYSVLSSYHDVKAHQIWLGTFHRGIILLDDRTWKPLSSLTRFSSLAEIPLIPVRSIIPYDAATILMAVDGAGVYAYDKKTCKTNLLLNTDGRPENVLHGNGVYALCKDHLGDLWIGSYSGSVDMAIPMEHTLETPGNLTDLWLSENQRNLVKALAQTGKPVVLVLNEGRPRLIADIEPLAQGVIDILIPGNMGGDALVNLVSGKSNFSGKMPYAYPKEINSLANYDFKKSEEVGTMEGAYDYNAKITQQWGFGYGLSYTSYKYSNLKVSQSDFRHGDIIKVSVDVKNTGKVAGKESVLLFSSDLIASMVPDGRRLRAFDKIELQPGETKTVTFDLNADDLAFVGYDGKWRLEEGDFKLMIADQNADIHCTDTYQWQSANR